MEGQKDTASEIAEVTVAVGDALNHLNGIVATLSEPVGVGAIEGVEDVWLPVLQHGETILELGDIGGEGKHTESAQAFLCLQRILGCHEFIELLFE